jgi:hypothetical protein
MLQLWGSADHPMGPPHQRRTIASNEVWRICCWTVLPCAPSKAVASVSMLGLAQPMEQPAVCQAGFHRASSTDLLLRTCCLRLRVGCILRRITQGLACPHPREHQACTDRHRNICLRTCKGSDYPAPVHFLPICRLRREDLVYRHLLRSGRTLAVTTQVPRHRHRPRICNHHSCLPASSASPTRRCSPPRPRRHRPTTSPRTPVSGASRYTTC